MNRTKPNFRAWREIIGLSQGDVADLVGVSVTAVKRWEHPDGPQPPDDAWEVIDQWSQLHSKAVETAIEIVEQQAEQIGEMPALVTLPYWRSQAEYDQFGRDPGFFGVINARTRAISQELRTRGIEVEFISHEDRGTEKDA